MCVFLHFILPQDLKPRYVLEEDFGNREQDALASQPMKEGMVGWHVEENSKQKLPVSSQQGHVLTTRSHSTRVSMAWFYGCPVFFLHLVLLPLKI